MLDTILKILFGFSMSVMVVWALIGFYRHVKRNRPRRRIQEFFKGIIPGNEYEYGENPTYLNEEINN